METSTDEAWVETFRDLWGRAVHRFEDGARRPGGFFTSEEERYLREQGCGARELFDFVEDHCVYGEPDAADVEEITAIRRRHFLEDLGGRHAEDVVDPGALPPKTEALEGVVWLPRILAKARAKLAGRLHEDVMYGCGGDRAFVRSAGMSLPEFLRCVESHPGDDQAVLACLREAKAAR